MPAHSVGVEGARVSSEWSAKVMSPPAFVDELDREGAMVDRVTSQEFAAACGQVADMVTAGTIRHGNQQALNDAVKAAQWRSAGAQGERAFRLKDTPEIGPLAAVVRALHGLAEQANYDVMDSVL